LDKNIEVLYSKNIIRKEVIEFDYIGNTDGLALQQNVDSWCKEQLHPSLEELFDKYESSNCVIQFDRLDIDVDLGQTKDWEGAVTQKIIQLIQEKIEIKLADQSATNEAKSRQSNFFELLLAYLHNGILPWQVTVRSRQEFEKALEFFLEDATVSEHAELQEVLKKSNAAKRFVILLNDAAFEKYTAGISGISDQEFRGFMKDMLSIAKLYSEEKNKQQELLARFKTEFICSLENNRSAAGAGKLITQFLHAIEMNNKGFAKKINPAYLRSVLVKEAVIDLLWLDTGASQNDGGQSKVSEWQKEDNANLKKILSDGAFVENAGAVIIAAFIYPLFAHVGLLHENEITDKNNALQLLHYSITGNDQPAEFELLLPKVLCGMEVEAIPEMYLPLDAAMLHQADEMLAAVINHWNVLKNTSVQGLRESFLQRSGKLSFDGNEWLLQVEQKPYDMLLQQLPWTISMIRLPWMPQVLQTEWIY
jgi:hypothetical protein